MSFYFRRRERREAHGLAARANCGQQRCRARSDKNDVRCRGRLFQSFQKRVGRGFVQFISLFNQEHARRTFKGAKVCFALKVAHRINQYGALVANRHPYVSVRAPDNFLVRVLIIRGREDELFSAHARRAVAAGFTAYRRSTVQGFRKLKREPTLAHALFACEQQRTGHAPRLQHAPQHLFHTLISH